MLVLVLATSVALLMVDIYRVEGMMVGGEGNKNNSAFNICSDDGILSHDVINVG